MTLNTTTPMHPGYFLKHNILDPLNISISEVAESLDLSRQAMSNFINGHADCSYEMAYRLELAFGLEAEHWLKLQQNYSLHTVKQKKFNITPYVKKKS